MLRETEHALPSRTLQRLRVTPLPRNVNPDNNPERRAARARTLTDTYASDTGALFVDAARYAGSRDKFVAVAVKATTGEIYSACSVRVRSAQQAEEAAIALALTDQRCSTVLSDSRSPIRSYARNRVCKSAVKICEMQCSDSNAADTVPVTYLRWFPAHTPATSGPHPNRNETADAAARALTHRAEAAGGTGPLNASEEPNESRTGGRVSGGVVRAASASVRCSVVSGPSEVSEDEEEADPLLGYAEVLDWYRAGRQTMPPPHPRLTREQAVRFRQLQTNSVLTPALARYVCPEVFDSEQCSVCGRATATLTHILWDCTTDLCPPGSHPGGLPTDVVRAMQSRDYEVQLQVVQRVEAALARQSRGRADAARDRGMRALGTARGPAGPSGGRGDTAP